MPRRGSLGGERGGLITSEDAWLTRLPARYERPRPLRVSLPTCVLRNCRALSTYHAFSRTPHSPLLPLDPEATVTAEGVDEVHIYMPITGVPFLVTLLLCSSPTTEKGLSSPPLPPPGGAIASLRMPGGCSIPCSSIFTMLQGSRGARGGDSQSKPWRHGRRPRQTICS